MDKIEFKQRVVDRAKEKQQSIVKDFKQRIDEIKGSEADIDENQSELDRKSLNEQSNFRINHLADQLNFALDELNMLNRIKVEEPLHEEIGFGSVVLTNKKNFFVSASIEDFKADGKEIFGLSVQAPIYKMMKGKTAGDNFSMNNEKYKIKEVL